MLSAASEVPVLSGLFIWTSRRTSELEELELCAIMEKSVKVRAWPCFPPMPEYCGPACRIRRRSGSFLEVLGKQAISLLWVFFPLQVVSRFQVYQVNSLLCPQCSQIGPPCRLFASVWMGVGMAGAHYVTGLVLARGCWFQPRSPGEDSHRESSSGAQVF